MKIVITKFLEYLEDPNNNLPILSQQYYYSAEESLQEVSSVNVSGTTKVSLSNYSSMVTDQNLKKKMEINKKRKHNSKFKSAKSNDTSEVVENGKKQRKNRGGDDKKN